MLGLLYLLANIAAIGFVLMLAGIHREARRYRAIPKEQHGEPEYFVRH